MSNVEEVQAVVIDESSISVELAPASIKDNLAEVEAFVDNTLSFYRGAEIDINNDDHVKEARKVMADLNKLKNPIEDERKRIKREYEAPLKAFEARVKSITSKIDKARSEIKEQVDEADRLWKQKREELLYEDFLGVAGDFASLVDFNVLLDGKWLNRSTPESKAINELEDKVQKALEGFNAIKEKNLTYRDQVIDYYLRTLDIIAALSIEDQLIEEAKRLEEARKKREEIEAERLKRIQEMHAVEQRKSEVSEVSEEAQPTTPVSQIRKWTIEVEATKEQVVLLSEVLKSNNIHGRIISK